ncbi:NEDD4-binding protein 1 [Hondaea fermentalgiana]|uniref:NEDD4-binding protein 1 n=1 Tax=Hondaea fermentalgiana TaxID=2315210 RepID=A0A2R5G2I1_9STRA|nr:NEDD4-binding protein 1 [Hondaea fermentalgiana]|eukprot:GBG25210.1 NEDD4-binding protein 1 [Hondaea fermentalgiana]
MLGAPAAAQPLSIVLDAANVSWAFVKAQPGWAQARSGAGIRPPVSGLVVCLEFFKSYGVSPVAICPTWWTHTKDQGIWGNPDWEAQDFARLQALQQEGTLFASPSGEHDDLYILDYCFRTDGFLVSNDKYRDHRRERNLDPDWIEARRIGFMFVRDSFLPNPDHIMRLEDFVRQTGKLVGSSAMAQHRHELLPPPPPTQDLGALRDQYRNGNPSFSDQNGQQDVMMASSPELKAAPAPPIPAVTSLSDQESLEFPKAGLGFLIGKRGAKIEEIRKDSGASVEIRDAVVDAAGNARVILAGSESARARARAAVLEMREIALRKLGNDAPNAAPRYEDTNSKPSQVAKGDPVGMGHHNAPGYEQRLAHLQQQQQQEQRHGDSMMQDDHMDDMHDDLL